LEEWKREKASWITRILELNILTMTILLLTFGNIPNNLTKISFVLSATLFAGNLIFSIIIFWIEHDSFGYIGDNSKKYKLFLISDKIILLISLLSFISLFIGLLYLLITLLPQFSF